MLLPGRAPQRFECVTAHACVYFGKITMGGLCIYSAWQNHFVDCVENQWHVSFSACLCSAQRRAPSSTWWRSYSTPGVPDTCSCSHLIVSSLPLVFSPLLSIMSSCASHCFLSSVDRGSMSHHLPWHVAVFDSMRWSVLSVLLLAWILASLDLAALIPMTGPHLHIKKKKKVWAHELVQGDFSNLNTERN